MVKYAKQHYVVKYVSFLRQAGCFLQILRFPPAHTIRHDIAKILLKVALDTKNLYCHIFYLVIKTGAIHTYVFSCVKNIGVFIHFV